MGYTPEQIDKMSIWEFDAVLEGYIDANSTEETSNSLTDEETEILFEDILSLS